MTKIFKKIRVYQLLILCFGCLFLGLSVTKITAVAEEKTSYYIKVNKLQNCVTVYEKDEKGKFTVPIKAMACSTGPATPLGTYNTLIKYRWKLLMGDVWGQYSTRIVKGILFHSVWYYEMNEATLSTTQYNKLGTSASHGCIRLTVADVKWIYDNCPIGTTVEIYNDKNPGPLGKPETLKLSSGTGWDPTDPSKENPYINKKPIISGATNKTIVWGKKIDLLKDVKATSTTGTDISSKLMLESKVNVYTAGKYKIKYTVSDAMGRTANKTVTITVKPTLEKPKIIGVADRSISSDVIVDRKFALEGVTAYLSTMKLSQKDIKVNIEKTTDNTYILEYEILGKNKKLGTASATVYVDTTSPVIEGISHKELTLGQIESGKSGITKLALKGLKVIDDYSKLSINQVKVTVKAKGNYAYIVTYFVADAAGNTTSETVQFTYFDYTRIDGVSNHHNLAYGTEITKEYVSQGITATNSIGDCTDSISTKISGNGNEYKVTYSIVNEQGLTISIVSFYTVEDEPIISEEEIIEEPTIEEPTIEEPIIEEPIIEEPIVDETI